MNLIGVLELHRDLRLRSRHDHVVQVSQIPRRFASGPAGEIPPANRSWRGAGGRDLRPKCHLPCSAEKLGELGDPGFQARLFWKRLWGFFLVTNPKTSVMRGLA